jgi:hypothetical protein
MAQMIEHNKCKALSSNHNTIKTTKKVSFEPVISRITVLGIESRALQPYVLLGNCTTTELHPWSQGSFKESLWAMGINYSRDFNFLLC